MLCRSQTPSQVRTPRDLIIIPGGRFIRTPGKSFCLVPRPIGGDVLLGRSDNFSATRKFFQRRENFEKKSLERRDRFRQKIVKIGAILAIFDPFEGWEIRVPLFGEFSRSSRDLYRNPLQIELSLGRLSKFLETWQVGFS